MSTEPSVLRGDPEDFILSVTVATQASLCEFLAARCPLSKLAIKDALVKGAVSLKRSGRKRQRVRKAKFLLQPHDTIHFCYDATVIRTVPPLAELLHETRQYSVWYKPARLFSQGTQYGDHCSLKRQVSLFYKRARDIKVVHRLDRDAAGLVLLAHSRQAAAKLSLLFSAHRIEKNYLASVYGKMGAIGTKFTFDRDIDGKPATTTATIVAVDNEKTTLTVAIDSGRKHQIRRHLSAAGFPLVGDRLYGGNHIARRSKTSAEALHLLAHRLAFVCPFSGINRTYTLPPHLFGAFTAFP